MIVKVALIMQAATLGQQCGSLYQRGHGSWIPFNLFQLVLVNFFYQGLLELQARGAAAFSFVCIFFNGFAFLFFYFFIPIMGLPGG